MRLFIVLSCLILSGFSNASDLDLIVKNYSPLSCKSIAGAGTHSENEFVFDLGKLVKTKKFIFAPGEIKFILTDSYKVKILRNNQPIKHMTKGDDRLKRYEILFYSDDKIKIGTIIYDFNENNSSEISLLIATEKTNDRGWGSFRSFSAECYVQNKS